MKVAYEFGITDYRNKDILQVGFAKFKQMGNQISELEKQMSRGWFLLPIGDETKTEEENLEMARSLKAELLSLRLKHITLLAVYENETVQEDLHRNGGTNALQKMFVMVPHENSFTEKFILEILKMLSIQYKQKSFFVKFNSENWIKQYCRKNSHEAEYAECGAMFASVEDVLENGVENSDFKCVFKGFRAPASWIDAVIMEHSGMIWY
jgi:hypothetical protein